jgi:hypothetical protein
MMFDWHVRPTQHGALERLHDVSDVPQALTQTLALLHAPEQQSVLLLHDAPIAVHAPPPPLSAGGDVVPPSGGGVGQHAALDWPQLSTQLPPQPFGTQHTPPVQTWPPGHAGQRIDPPQLLVTCTWHLLPQEPALSGVQHVSASWRHTSLDGQAVEPLTPQLTARPQLFVAWPHSLPAHVVAIVSGMQPHTLVKHETPASHDPQSTGLPQLSVVWSQRPLHQSARDWHWQTLLALHVSSVGQSSGQIRDSPQLSNDVPQWVSHQLGSGVHPASIGAGGSASKATVPSLDSVGIPASKATAIASGCRAAASSLSSPSSIPSSEPHASGAHAATATAPAIAKRADDARIAGFMPSRRNIAR